MLGRDVNMGAPDVALDLRPEAFDGVGMMNAVYPLIGGMVDGAVVVSEPRDFGVRGKFVRADGRAAHDIFKDMPLKGRLANVRNNPRDDIAVAFQHAEHYRLAGGASATLTASVPTTNVGFISFDVPIQRGSVRGNYIV